MLETVRKALALRKVLSLLMCVLSLSLAFAYGRFFEGGADNRTGHKVRVQESEEYSAGFGLYIDDAFVCAAKDCGALYAAVDGMKTTLAQVYGAPDGVHSINNDVRVVGGMYEVDSFVAVDEVAALLGDKGNVFEFSVCNVYGEDTGVAFSLSTVGSSTKLEAIEFDTEYIPTDLLGLGDEMVVVTGVDGLAENSYTDIYINGVCTESVLTDSKVISSPVDAEVWQGASGGAGLMAAGEKFMLPYDGRVSSWYGYRRLWGELDLHNGIDFVGLSGGCYGDPIYAAADGIVSFADWHGGYGKKVVIDHSESMSTLYAHCSQILVEEGQAVRKGQIIALIGNTGRVTGAHLHFGLEINGVECDPEPYIDWSAFKGDK